MDIKTALIIGDTVTRLLTARNWLSVFEIQILLKEEGWTLSVEETNYVLRLMKEGKKVLLKREGSQTLYGATEQAEA